jgi:hypothetical protein
MKAWRCWLRGGHAEILGLDQGRVYLECVECGFRSPGWSWHLAPPKPRTAKILRFNQRLTTTKREEFLREGTESGQRRDLGTASSITQA